jgi:hypothetical protein
LPSVTQGSSHRQLPVVHSVLPDEALATSLPLQITLIHAKFWLYKNWVYITVLLTYFRIHNKVLSHLSCRIYSLCSDLIFPEFPAILYRNIPHN